MSVAHPETYPTGLRLIIEPDEDPTNPRRELDHLCRMVCWHRRRWLGDPYGWSGPGDFRRAWRHKSFLELPLHLHGRRHEWRAHPAGHPTRCHADRRRLKEKEEGMTR
ncbi:MAG: hypothetical protein ACR2P3_02165 [Geminicoccaceae bacterium]